MRMSAMRILTCICSLMTLVIGAGVYALWEYGGDIQNSYAEAQVKLVEFEWAPEEVLPDEEEDTSKQQNHMVIVDEILFNQKMGLNKRIDAIDNAVAKDKLLHYVETIQGGNLKHLIDASEGGQNLGFVLTYVDENHIYGYSFYRIGQTIGAKIEVYRTLYGANTDPSVDVNKDGKMDVWVALSSQRGKAVTIKGIKGLDGNECSIDPATWEIAISGQTA